jgi:hypothetical protein
MQPREKWSIDRLLFRTGLGKSLCLLGLAALFLLLWQELFGGEPPWVPWFTKWSFWELLLLFIAVDIFVTLTKHVWKAARGRSDR